MSTQDKIGLNGKLISEFPKRYCKKCKVEHGPNEMCLEGVLCKICKKRRATEIDPRVHQGLIRPTKSLCIDCIKESNEIY